MALQDKGSAQLSLGGNVQNGGEAFFVPVKKQADYGLKTPSDVCSSRLCVNNVTYIRDVRQISWEIKFPHIFSRSLVSIF